MMFADDIVPCSTCKNVYASIKIRAVAGGSGRQRAYITRRKTKYLKFNDDQDSGISVERNNVEENGCA